METNKNNKRTWLGATFSFALVAIMGLTFAFKAGDKTVKTDDPESYFFKYNGPIGSEADQSLWSLVEPTEPACDGRDDGCLIEVDKDYTILDGSNVRLISEPVPVITSGVHQNPDTSSDMIVSAAYKN